MTESIWKIEKLDWKCPGFFLPKEREPCDIIGIKNKLYEELAASPMLL